MPTNIVPPTTVPSAGAGDEPRATRAGGAGPGPRRRRRTARWLLVALLTLLAVLGVCAGLLLRDALAARDALVQAAEDVPAVEQAILDGVVEPGTSGKITDLPELAALQEHTTVARASTDGLLWELAGRLPVIGPTAAAATTVSTVLDDVSDVVIPALAGTGDAVAATQRTADGGLDLAPLQNAAGPVAVANATLADARERLDALDPATLRPELADSVSALQDRLADLDGVLATADRATTVLPTLLGADEPRTFLLLALTNAELRAAGGIPGALVLLRVEDGRAQVVRQVPSSALGRFPEPVLPLDPDDVAVHSERLGTFVQDVTATPDFPTTARLAAAMWAQRQGEQVDGVLATDPVALAYLLRATGPVRVDLDPDLAAGMGSDRIRVTDRNVVDLVLRHVYDHLDAEQADRFFAVVASTVMDRVMGEDVDARGLVPALRAASAEHRVRVWSADPGEQARLEGTVLAGTFTEAPQAADAVGVFFADGVAGKMSSYLDANLEHVRSQCAAEGRVDELELRLRSAAPADAATSLPAYVAGRPGGASPPGTIRLNVDVAGPRDGAMPRLERDGNAFGGESATAHGRPVTSFTVVLAPGESTTVRVRVAAAEGSTAEAGTVDLWSTPTTTLGGLQTFKVPACG